MRMRNSGSCSSHTLKVNFEERTVTLLKITSLKQTQKTFYLRERSITNNEMLMGQLYGIIADVKSSSLYPPTNLNLFSKSYTKG